MTIGNTSKFSTDNPTANKGLRKIETKYNPIKSTASDMNSLEILCTKCTIFDKDNIINKVLMKHDDRNELFRCVNNYNHVHSDNQIRYALKLQLPEYIHYNKKKTVKDINTERQEHEKFIIEPINAQSPTELSAKQRVKAIKNKPIGKMEDVLRK